MQVLTSLSGLPFSAASAGFAPTNSADVSAIASAYQVVSSTSTQLHAGTAYLTGVNGAPISASRAGQAANASLSNSAYYDGTGRLISALPDSAAVSAIASSYAESAASGKQDTLEFGYDDGKISSIDGSAIAGGGGGGGLVTSIESALDPWYHTSISGLNGSSLYSQFTESARVAEYATSAASATTAYYAQSAPTAWASSFITGVASPSGTIRVIDGTAIEGTNSAMLPSTVIPGFESASAINADSWSPGTSIGPGVYVTGTIPSENPYTNLVLKMGWGDITVSVTGDNGETASVSKVASDEYVTAQLPNATSYSLTTDGWVTLYAITASAVTQEIGGGVGELAWASALPTYEYDGDGKISAIDGSALAGGGGGGATGDYVEKSASSVAIGTEVSASGISFAQGSGAIASGNSIAIGLGSRASSNSVALGNLNSAMSGSIAQGYQAYAYYSSMAQGNQTHATNNSFAQGTFTEAHNSSMAQGFYALASGNSFAQGLRASAKASSVALGPFAYASGNSFAYGRGASAINSATVFGTENQSGDGSGASGAAFVIGDGTASNARHDLMVVTKDGEITMFSGTADTVGTGIMSSIRAISAAATGGGGGVDSATVSAIASAYVESGVSSKLDSSASSSFYTTANESGFVDSAYVESSVSGKQDASAMSAYALSSDVSGTVDLVSSQSANWGGSALQLSAGPGVTFTKSGNVLVAGLDETVLWSGYSSTTTTATTYNLSENIRNFLKFKVVASPNEQPQAGVQRPLQEFVFNLEINSTSDAIYAQFPTYNIGGNTLTVNYWYLSGGPGVCTSLGILAGARQVNGTVTTGVTSYSGSICQIWGINRTAEA